MRSVSVETIYCKANEDNTNHDLHRRWMLQQRVDLSDSLHRLLHLALQRLSLDLQLQSTTSLCCFYRQQQHLDLCHFIKKNWKWIIICQALYLHMYHIIHSPLRQTPRAFYAYTLTISRKKVAKCIKKGISTIPPSLFAAVFVFADLYRTLRIISRRYAETTGDDWHREKDGTVEDIVCHRHEWTEGRELLAILRNWYWI